MAETPRVTRRQFLASASAGAAALSLGFPALGRTIGANDRIIFAVLGCGGQGTGHVHRLTENKDKWNVQVAAVCDIYDKRKQRAREASGGGEICHDYRQILDRKDIDAVVIASPDHWHAPMALDALQAGKDVYLEKPMTHTWKEARDVHRMVQRTGRVLQVGSQHTSEDQWHRAAEVIRGQGIGKVLWSQGSYSRNSLDGEWNWTIDPDAGPDNIDWRAFLGNARKRPWDPDRFFRWRKYWDYSGGIATDLHYHKLAPLLIAVGPEFPIRVTSAGGIYEMHDREVPDTFISTIEYPSQHTIVLASSMANDIGLDTSIRGHEGTIYTRGNHIDVVPQGVFKDKWKQKYGSDEVIRVDCQPREGHTENFLRCVRTREKPVLDSELGYKAQVAISLSVLAYRQNRTLCFDPDREQLTSQPPDEV